MNELEPSEFYLAQNYPNPFKGKTAIKYCVAYKTRVRITVYNTEGEVMERLVDEEKNPGTYEVELSASGGVVGGRQLEVGDYYCCLKAGEYKSEKKMLLIK
jgi:hypothetical protein